MSLSIDHVLFMQNEAPYQQDSSPFHSAEDFSQPSAVISMGHQTSRGSDAEAGTTSVHSHQALHRSPNRSMHSRERLPSGLLKDFRVGGEEGASNRAHLSDDISGSNASLDGCNLSDKHERTMLVLPSVRALTGAAGNVPFGSDDEQEPSPLMTLAGKNPSPRSSSPVDLAAEHTGSLEVAHQLTIMEHGEQGHLVPQTTFGTEAHDAPGLQYYFLLLLVDILLQIETSIFCIFEDRYTPSDMVFCVYIQVDVRVSAHKVLICQRVVLVTCPSL